MATGIPRKLRTGHAAAENGSLGAVQLEYPGKQAAADILRTPPASYEAVWVGVPSPNRLYFGDNLGALAALRRDPQIVGRVKLVYIDPPYATRTVFHCRNLNHAYEDISGGAEYLEAVRSRLILLHELLAADGAIYLHLDEKMVFHVKVLMDELFGADNYRNCITRKKCNPKNYTSKAYGNVADYILFYTKSAKYIWNRPTEPWTPERAREYQYVEPETGRRFMKVPVHAPGVRRGETGQPWRGMLPPPGKHWQYPPKKLEELDARGEIYWSPNGNPRRKVYLDGSPGVGVQDIWLHFRDAHNQNIRITGYPTEKNPDLLRRIVEASSNPGDLVLDCYAGSGTTLAVSSDLGRRWIGIDNSPEAIATTLERFVTGPQLMGDFVSQRQCPSASLYDECSEDSGDEASRSGSGPTITDFTLFADVKADLSELSTSPNWGQQLDDLQKRVAQHRVAANTVNNAPRSS